MFDYRRKKEKHTSYNTAYLVTALARVFTHICLRYATANIRYAETLGEIAKILLTINITHMEKEPKQEILKSMSCTSVEKPIAELEKEGWEFDWSFHVRFPEQWNDACDRVEKIKSNGFWEPALVQGQNEAELKDGVAYIYKRKTDKYKQYEKDMGYVK